MGKHNYTDLISSCFTVIKLSHCASNVYTVIDNQKILQDRNLRVWLSVLITKMVSMRDNGYDSLIVVIALKCSKTLS